MTANGAGTVVNKLNITSLSLKCNDCHFTRKRSDMFNNWTGLKLYLKGLHTVVGNFVWVIAKVKSNLLTNANNHGNLFKAASLHQFFMTCTKALK